MLLENEDKYFYHCGRRNDMKKEASDEIPISQPINAYFGFRKKMKIVFGGFQYVLALNLLGVFIVSVGIKADNGWMAPLCILIAVFLSAISMPLALYIEDKANPEMSYEEFRRMPRQSD